MCTKAFLPGGGAAVISVPTYAMYRVHAEQRGARVIAVARLGQDAGWAMDVPAVRAAARDASLVWVCNPNNPTGLPEPAGAIEALLTGLAADAAATGAPSRLSSWTRRTPSSPTTARSRSAPASPTSSSSGPRSKAYALAGLRVGFAVAAPETLRRVALYRPPGSIGTISATAVARALSDITDMEANVARVAAERPRLAAAFAEVGWRPQPSVTNFILLDLVTAERSEAAADALMHRGLVPRTFGHGHPLAHCIRVTVRAPHENDRIVAAAREIAPTLPAAPDTAPETAA
jgi:histidinol-phosphate aminotransferase